MATDWVVNADTYGDTTDLSVNEIAWLPLTHQQVPTTIEQGNTEQWAHFEAAPSYTLRVRGHITIQLGSVFSDLADQGGQLIARVVRNRMDPVTNEPGLPAGSTYLLDDARDANDDYLWQDIVQWWSVTSWVSTGNSPALAYIMPVDVKVTRRLDPPDQLWLVMHYVPLTPSDAPRLEIVPYLRTLVADKLGR